ncbi:MAG: ATP-binding protein, partial [Thermodesulfobacteriota bacterium]
MTEQRSQRIVPIEKLRWHLDPATLPFETTGELNPLKEIVGQDRGVQAFHFGIRMKKPGYNIFVTGQPGSGRKATVKQLLEELADAGPPPDDLCYVNNFQSPESPILIRLPAGQGTLLKQEVKEYVSVLRKEIPNIFTSDEYVNAKKEILEASEKKAKGFFKNLDQKVKEEGFALVDIQVGQGKRPELMPLVDGQPVHIDQLEDMTEKGRFPKEEYHQLRKRYENLKEQIDRIFQDLRELQKEVQSNMERMDRAAFIKAASGPGESIAEKYKNPKVNAYFKSMLQDMADNLSIFQPQAQPQMPGLFPFMPEADSFQTYSINLLVDNSLRKRPPVIVEEYPTFKNIFGNIDRIVDRSGIWRTDFSKIKAGSLLHANGGYLVFYLHDAMVEPGVWQGLKRALKSKKLEFQSFDPFNFFSSSGMKPEPIELDVKVVIMTDSYLFHLLQYYDEDVKKIFKVRADFNTSMDKTDQNIVRLCEFIKTTTDEEHCRPFDRTAAAALIEEAVRMTGRQEKISSLFPAIKDLILDADHWAGTENRNLVEEKDVDKAVASKIF